MTTEQEIKVSVVVTTYNQQDTIARTLDSILRQECGFDYEIVIGEDCSTDGTLTVCKEYARRFNGKIRLIANPRNKGLVANYYDCLLQCRGRYIADCAGDDYWIDSRKLQKQYDMLERNPDVTLVHTDWQYVDSLTGTVSPSDPDGKKSQFRKPILHGRDIVKPLICHEATPIVHLCTAMYRRDTFLKAYNDDRGLFRDKSYTCEDLQLIVSLAMMGDIAFLPDITLNYSTGSDTVSYSVDHAKTFDFYMGAFLPTLHLAQKAGIASDKEFIGHAKSTLQFILAQAFNSRDLTRRNRFAAFVRRTKLPLSAKTRIMLMLSSFHPLWDLCTAIRNHSSL